MCSLHFGEPAGRSTYENMAVDLRGGLIALKCHSQTIEFNVEVPAHGEKEVAYTVTYTW